MIPALYAQTERRVPDETGTASAFVNAIPARVSHLRLQKLALGQAETFFHLREVPPARKRSVDSGLQ
jgi:hypothetical protein